MKILVATEKPFAAVAVEGIRKEIEGAGHELILLEKGTKDDLLKAVVEADGHLSSAVTLLILPFWMQEKI